MAADALASLSPDENPARADALGAALAQHVARPGRRRTSRADHRRRPRPRHRGAAARTDRRRRASRPRDSSMSSWPRGARCRSRPAGCSSTAWRRRSPESELAFTAEEAAELLGDVRPAQTLATVDTLLHRTGGWAVAIAFAARGAAGSGVRRPRRRRPRATGSCSPTSPKRCSPPRATATRAALRVAATLPWLTTELAAHLGLGEAGARLADPDRPAS